MAQKNCNNKVIIFSIFFYQELFFNILVCVVILVIYDACIILRLFVCLGIHDIDK